MDTANKRCPKCGTTKPRTTEFFSVAKSRHDGLNWICKECGKIAGQLRKERGKQFPVGDPSKVKMCTVCKQEFPATNEFFHTKFGGKLNLTHNCKACEKHHHKEWYENNKTYEIKRVGEWGKKNKNKRRAAVSKFYRNNPKKRRVRREVEIARKRSQPHTMKGEDWQYALNYFGGCCAVCGKPPDFWTTIAMDHWIPVSSPDCPGTVASNIIPLCHAIKGGEGGCNNEKGNKDALIWLIEKHGQSKGKGIANKIKSYIDHIGSKNKS